MLRSDPKNRLLSRAAGAPEPEKQQDILRGLANLETAPQNGAALAFVWFYPQHPAAGDHRSLAEPRDRYLLTRCAANKMARSTPGNMIRILRPEIILEIGSCVFCCPPA
jgi:hypothetical protein